MSLEKSALKYEHNGAKNRGHDKWAPRGDLKVSAKKYRRRDAKAQIREAMKAKM